MLTIEHLTKQFGEKTLFRDLCLTVEGPAVLWAPSGWGKTTLLRILMGLEEPTSGIVQGVGRVAAVFQEDRLCPQLTAVQNVTLVLPGSAEQYKEQIINDFQQFGMDHARWLDTKRKTDEIYTYRDRETNFYFDGNGRWVSGRIPGFGRDRPEARTPDQPGNHSGLSTFSSGIRREKPLGSRGGISLGF